MARVATYKNLRAGTYWRFYMGDPCTVGFDKSLIALFLVQWRNGRGLLPRMFFGREEEVGPTTGSSLQTLCVMVQFQDLGILDRNISKDSGVAGPPTF